MHRSLRRTFFRPERPTLTSRSLQSITRPFQKRFREVFGNARILIFYLSIKAWEEKSLPKSHLGWFFLVFGEGKATKENMSIFWFIWPLNWHYLTVRSLTKCCSVDGGRGICPPFFVPTPRIWHLKSPHPREFAIQGKKMLMPGGQPWGGLGAGGIDWCINNGVFLDTYHVSPPNILSLTTVIVIS